MSQKQIKSALISVFYKDGLEPVLRQLERLQVKIYSTGGTQKFIEDLGIACTPVEEVTTYPSILGGRVKTLHPSVFGGILGRRELTQDLEEMKQYNIPEIDLVIVDLYPFEETVKNTSEEQLIIEKIDIGGPSMIRAAAKNHKDLTVIAAKEDYAQLEELLRTQEGSTTLEQRRAFAAKAFYVVMNYDIAINNNKIQDTREKLNLLLQKNTTDYETAGELIAVGQQQLKIARNNMFMAGKQFEEGLIDVTERLEAENDLFKASLNYYMQVVQQRKTALEILHTTGQLLDEIKR